MKKYLKMIIVVIAACIIHGVMQGVHDNYGIMMTGIIEHTNISYSSVSLCIGIGALVYGVAQPFLGMLALKKSNAFVIMAGIIFTVAGLLITPLCKNVFMLFIFFGLVLPLGTTGLCFGIVMGAITPVLGEKRAVVVSGIVQASAGVGDALMSPGLEALISKNGISFTMNVLTVPFIIMIPIVIRLGYINKKSVSSEITEKKNQTSFLAIIKTALNDRDYRLLLLSFATCGFNMSIIESHLFSQYLSYGIDGNTASLTLTIYGITTMTGTVLVGFLGVKFKLKNILGTVYAVRVLVSLAFIFAPKSVAFAFAATALLGCSGDSTVPPTSGIISKKFGAENMAVLYGFALIGHQAACRQLDYLICNHMKISD